MENIQYNIQFEKLCDTLDVGKLICDPEQVTGGLLHRMYSVETTTGKYAVKTLNPQVMLRPKAKSDIVNGERIAEIAADFIPALPAKKFGDKFLQQIDGQYYLVYDWIEGKSLYGENITVDHCEKIGGILGKLHNIDYINRDYLCYLECELMRESANFAIDNIYNELCATVRLNK